MDKISVASFAASVSEARPPEISYKLAHLPWQV